ncbi:MAG: BTAD domain-containing putative transcriptional regulator [Acidimicrobiales bacterium]
MRTEGGDHLIEVNDLGPIVVAGRPLSEVVKSPIQRLVFAALVLRSPDAVSSDALTDLIWPDRAVDKSMLWTHVYRLRRALEDLGLEVARLGDGYALATPVSLDSVAFGEAVINAKAMIVSDPDQAIERLDAALDLWRGEPHDGIDLERMMPGFGRELDDRRVQAMTARAIARLANGDPTQAAVEIEELLSDSPYDEGAAEALVVALAESGRRTDALRRLRDFRLQMVEDLGLDPGPGLADLERSLLEGGAVTSASLRHWQVPTSRQDERGEPLRSLPAAQTNLIGRSEFQSDLGAAVLGSRLVTLTGVGGVGKTSLAIEAARELATEFPDGICLVDVGSITDAENLPKRFADAAGLRIAGSSQDQGLADEVAAGIAEKQLLVIVDNCETAIEAAAHFVSRILTVAGPARVLATSREALSIDGELVLQVPPLTIAQGVELLSSRALAVNDKFDIDRESAALATICELLDGLPLALELAAAQMVYVNPGQLAEMLDDRFELLKRGRGPTRHQSLLGVMEASWASLDADERGLLASVSAFVGSFTIDAAAAAVDQTSLATVLGLMRSLHTKSLITLVQHDDGTKYRLLETVRIFAGRKLADMGEETQVRDRLLHWFINFADELARGIHSDEELRWVTRVDLEMPNIVAIAEWARRNDRSDELIELCGLLEPECFLRLRPELGPVVRRHAAGLARRSDPRLGVVVGSLFRLGFGSGSDRDAADLESWFEAVDWQETVATSPTARLAIAARARTEGDSQAALDWVKPLPNELWEQGLFGESCRVRATVALYMAGVDLEAAEEEARRAVAACEEEAGDGSTAVALAWASGVVQDPAEQLALASRAADLGAATETALASSTALTRIAQLSASDERLNDEQALAAIERTLRFHRHTLNAERSWSTLVASIVGLAHRGYCDGVVEAWNAVVNHGTVGLALPSLLAQFDEVESYLVGELGAEEYESRRPSRPSEDPNGPIDGLLQAISSAVGGRRSSAGG